MLRRRRQIATRIQGPAWGEGVIHSIVSHNVCYVPYSCSFQGKTASHSRIICHNPLLAEFHPESKKDHVFNNFSGVVTFWLFRDIVSMEAGPTTFHELYSRYAGDVYRFAHWLTGNPHDAQDITLETFVRAWTAPEEPRMETVKAYLFTIARNLHRNQWRRQSRLPDQAAQPDEAAVNQDEFRRTLEAVQALPEMARTVLLLRAEQELSYEDIAAVTGLSVAAARVIAFRARAKLAALLHPNPGEKL
jgi:RNA polymerase sigma factor (sigma-70 family)